MSDGMLPAFNKGTSGSGCPNPDCEASDRQLRVISEKELNRMFAAKSELSITPLPPQATHVCERCGHVFADVNDQLLDDQKDDPTESRPDVDIDSYDWEPEMVYDATVRDSGIALVEGAPQDAGRKEVEEAIERYIPGAGRDEATLFIEAADREFDAPAHNAGDFM